MDCQRHHISPGLAVLKRFEFCKRSNLKLAVNKDSKLQDHLDNFCEQRQTEELGDISKIKEQQQKIYTSIEQRIAKCNKDEKKAATESRQRKREDQKEDRMLAFRQIINEARQHHEELYPKQKTKGAAKHVEFDDNCSVAQVVGYLSLKQIECFVMYACLYTVYMKKPLVFACVKILGSIIIIMTLLCNKESTPLTCKSQLLSRAISLSN